MALHKDPNKLGFSLVEVVAVVMVVSILVMILLPATQRVRESARRISCTHNLTQFSLAVQNYENLHRRFPAGSIDPKTPILSVQRGYHHGWLTRILPQLDLPNIDSLIDRRVGVYHPNNTVPSSELPAVFNCASSGGGLAFAAVHNSVEVPISETNNGAFILNRFLKRKEFKDGLSNTLFLGEIGGSFNWMSGSRETMRNFGTPLNQLGGINTGVSFQDFSLEAKSGTEYTEKDFKDGKTNVATAANAYVGGFSSSHPMSIGFAFGDGSVKVVSKQVDLLILQRLADRNDGKLVAPID